MLRKMILAGAVLAGSVVAGTGVVSAQDPVSPASVSPTTISVKGNVVEPAALPRTGGDIGMDVVAGVGLTAAGLALAMAARQRRRKYETAAIPAS